MPSFRYQAIDPTGLLIKGSTHAASDQELEARLAEKGMTLVSAKMRTQVRWKKHLLGERIRKRDIIEFYYRLHQTLDLGLPILSALEENASHLPSRPMRRIVDKMRMNIENGNSLTTAMSNFPKVFDGLERAIVHMGEETGRLPRCLKDLSTFLEWKEEIRSTVRRASIYPSFILIVIVAVIGVWIGYVLPQLAELLLQMGVELPAMTRFTLALSDFFKQWWAGFIVCPIIAGIAIYLLQRTKEGGVFFHKQVLKLPIVGGIFTNIAMARLSQNFATMYQAGMSINGIFELLSKNVLGNRFLERLLQNAFHAIQQGDSISDSFMKAGGFPSILLGAIRNGETTGTLDAAFERLGQYYDREAKRSVQSMIAALEPLSIMVLGGVFGSIILSILLPLYDVIGEF
jgi:type II secretory pathway component PulF